jgi:regulator of protease activity HflC (stomatin/prohibitin superfamily)
MKTINLKLAIYGFLIAIVLNGCAVVKPGHKAMKWKPWGEGLITEKIYNDGPIWHWPWVGVVDYSTQWQTFSENVSVLTKDELHIEMTVSVTLRPILSELPKLEMEVGRNYYNSVVKPEFLSTTRNIFAKHAYANVSPHSPEIEVEIFTALIEKTKGKYLEFDNVTIDHIIYPAVVSSAVNKKLAVEQDIEQKDYEIEIAKKTAEIQRVLARGQRDAQTIIDSSITKKYLQYKALEVQDKLATSSNAKFYFVPMGKDGLPIIVDSGTGNK